MKNAELAKEIQRLEALRADVTDAPLVLKSSFDIECEGCGDDLGAICADCRSTDQYETSAIQVCGMESFAKPTAELIVAAWNALPDLLAAAKRLTELTEALRPLAALAEEYEAAEIDATVAWDASDRKAISLYQARAARVALAAVEPKP